MLFSLTAKYFVKLKQDNEFLHIGLKPFCIWYYRHNDKIDSLVVLKPSTLNAESAGVSHVLMRLDVSEIMRSESWANGILY